MSNYDKRIERGLRWLRKHGYIAGLEVRHVIAAFDQLDLSDAHSCVLGYASGEDDYRKRAQAFHRVAGNPGYPNNWAERNGFDLARDSDEEYRALTEAWRARLLKEPEAAKLRAEGAQLPPGAGL